MRFFAIAVPLFFTFANFFAGCLGLCFAVLGYLEHAAHLVMLGIFFDFFDGFFARLLKSISERGKQLDSFSDMVTSGLVPAVVMAQLFCRALDVSFSDVLLFKTPVFLPFLGFLIAVASAYRLAKFNLGGGQVHFFMGLPTPANALWIISLPFLYPLQNIFTNLLGSYFFLGVLTFISIFLLNAPIPMFTLKFKNFSLRKNWLRYGFILFGLLFFIWLKILAFPVVIFIYVLISMLRHFFRMNPPPK